MKKHDLPAMPFYWGDWFKAVDVMSLPKDIRDTWFLMLGRMWESKKRGFLCINGKKPTDEEMCAILAFGNVDTLNPTLKAGVISEMQRNIDFLRSRDIFSVDENGIIFCRRMVRDEEKRLKFTKFGKKGGNPKLLKRDKGRDNQVGYPSPEDENENENERSSSEKEVKNKKEVKATNEPFELARKAYPGTKRGYQTEFDDFCRKHKDWREALEHLLPAIEAEIENKKTLIASHAFCPEWPHFKTWLSKRRWEDEPGKPIPTDTPDPRLVAKRTLFEFEKGAADKYANL